MRSSIATSRLWTPRLALGSCLRGIMARDTRGAALAEPSRYNHFPATPMASITWWLSGTCEQLAAGAAAEPGTARVPMLADVVFRGPQARPTITWNPGDVHSLTVVLAPDALRLLTGLEPGQWLNRWAPAADVLPIPWQVLMPQVSQAPDDGARVRLVQDFLECRWRDARLSEPSTIPRYRDWALALALRAATSAPGRSVRQLERRIKEWAGQPLRELRGLGRLEQAFFDAILAQDAQQFQWADVAAGAGYADQSHLCRETRRLTGFAPEELRRRIRDDEGFWPYRIWR